MRPNSKLLWIVWISLASAAGAQTRAEQIEAEQRSKDAHLTPEVPNRVERIFNQAQIGSGRLFGTTAGFRPVIGNMVTGSGFAGGVEYYRPDLKGGNLVLRTSARASIWAYELLDAQLTAPHLAGGRMFVDLYGAYRNNPRMTYYGPGPDSEQTGRTDYRLEDTSASITAGVRPFRHLRMGATAGYLRVNVGPGTADQYASTDRTYTEAQTPGIHVQSDFLRAGPFIQYDYRDRPADPHRGGNYIASYVYYDDIGLGTGSHGKLYGEVQQYIPFFNEKRVIALRAKTELSYRGGDQVVPFYLQPVLGGSEDLRGFRPFRFYDNNLLALTAEYRWEIMTGFDMALFADAGKVFHRHADLDFTDLETSAGFGLRFKTRDAVFMRWDVGFSHEGFQVWIKFNNVF